ncbi:hypothetical protein OG948_18105 [Embleya sp. NBC_00888]|uniref:hypothetical protein n=1 Tax=Embleya sp. NBC_00888 TaxID=2975960 RepID=UPI0038678DE3|nr:hypothetical protein OG948_18105 [Embleya sp. NBC_00888]
MTSLSTPELLDLIRPHTGEPSDIRPASRGFSSDVATVIEGGAGNFFVKAVRNRPGGRRESLLRERLVNPTVQPISPALRWHAENDDWMVLGFEAIEGRRSDFAPTSPDLPAIVDTLNRIGALDLPEVAHDWHETRWNRFATDEAQTTLFQGDALLHTDINPDNVMIGRANTWAVDWSWPTRGAGFIDPACLAVQLIAAGHSARSAESWASDCTAWTKADPNAISAFAAATLRMYRAFAERKPEAAWLGAMAEAAQSWVVYRGVDT